jgi:hypothetical protein
MKAKRIKKMLLVGGALVTTPLATTACHGGIANPKGCFYDDGAYVDGITGLPCDFPDASDGGNDANPFGDAGKKDASDAGDATTDATSDAAGDATSDATSDAPTDANDDGG